MTVNTFLRFDLGPGGLAKSTFALGRVFLGMRCENKIRSGCGNVLTRFETPVFVVLQDEKAVFYVLLILDTMRVYLWHLDLQRLDSTIADSSWRLES